MTSIASRLLARLPLILLVSGVVLVGLHLAGIATLRHLVETQLHPALPKGTRIGEVHLNPFRGAIEVRRFYLRTGGTPRIRADRLVADVDVLKLLRGVVKVERVVLEDAYLRIERLPAGDIDLGLPDFGGESASSEGPPPDVTVDRVSISGLTVDYRDGERQSLARVRALDVGKYSLQAESQKIPVKLDMLWDGQPIVADFDIRLADGGMGAAGALSTGTLDLAWAQRLARLEPQVVGALEFDGRFDWDGTTANLNGRLAAPRLQYQVGGRDVALDRVAVPEFDLALALEPTLQVEFRVDRQMTADSWTWAADGQRVAGEGGTARARIAFTDGGRALVEDLVFAASTLDWADAGRSLAIEDVEMSGRASQSLTGDAVLPGMAITVNIGRLRYSDSAAELTVEVERLAAREAVLSDDGKGPARGLSAQLRSGPLVVQQAANALEIDQLGAQMVGTVSLTEYRLDSDVALQKLSIAAPALPNGTLSLEGVEVDGLTLGERIGTGTIRLRGLDLPGGLAETGLAASAVDVRGGAFDPAGDAVSIDEITVEGLQTAVIRDDAGVWQHAMTPSGAPGEGSRDVPAASAANGSGEEGASLAWRLGGLKVGGDSHVTLADRLNPDTRPLRYRIERVELGELDSRKPGAATSFAILMRPDRFSEFEIAGTARPLDAPLFLDAAGHLHGFGLTSVNGLVANDLGHRFRDGQFDIDFEIKIDSSRLQMANQLALSSVDVEELPGKEGPPLATAIALLEDRDGNIKLEVPIEGDLSDPGFRVLGALDPIITKAVAGAAALAIQPLGSVLLVGSLVADQALKVSFEPVPFDAGSTGLNAAARDYLKQFAAKLNDKPKLAVRICGLYAAQERERDKGGKFTDDPEEILELAQQRADAAKTYMREQGVDSKQLRKCRPAIDPTDAGLPRVDIRF